MSCNDDMTSSIASLRGEGVWPLISGEGGIGDGVRVRETTLYRSLISKGGGTFLAD